MTVLKPFLLVACVAFVTGFAAYCALYRLANAPAEVVTAAPSAAPSMAAAASAAPADDPLPGKRI